MISTFDFTASGEADVVAVFNDQLPDQKIVMEWQYRPPLMVGRFTTRHLRDVYRELQIDFVDGRVCFLRLTMQTCTDFTDWVLRRKCLTSMQIEIPLPTGGAKAETFTFSQPQKPKASCPVCYGTGFHKGFGAPCSKGCKAP